MAKNLNFYFDNNGVPRARGKHSEKLLMSFLETDVQGSEYICQDLMNDLAAVEDESADSREFIGNAHRVNITPDGVVITSNIEDDVADAQSPTAAAAENIAPPVAGQEPDAREYITSLKHFREIMEDWEAFILDEQDPIDDSLHV